MAATAPTGVKSKRLRLSHFTSFFEKGEEVYLYHDFWGYVMAMDAVTHAYITAFRDGAHPAAVCAAFADRLPDAQMQGFLGELKRYRTLVPMQKDERANAFEHGYPVRGPWLVSWRRSPAHVVLAYRDRARGTLALEPLDELEAQIFALCDGEHTMCAIADALEGAFPHRNVDAAVMSFVFRLTHSDRQVLKLAERTLLEYLNLTPPYLRTVVPFPRLSDTDALEEGGAGCRVRSGGAGHDPDVVDLASYHGDAIDEAHDQFDVQETTLSHMFRDPHPVLGGRTYAAAFCGALIERGILPDTGQALEIGGGVGFFAQRMLEAIDASHGDSATAATAPALRYAILDLSPALQRSQRRLSATARSRVRFLRANASKPLPLAAGSVDLLISNEVIADLETVRLRLADHAAIAAGELDPSTLHPLKAETWARLERLGVTLDHAPEVFWVNAGALALVEELARVLAPGGSAVLTEFGEEDRFPVESIQLDHAEFSIHFGMLRDAALALGLEVELTDIVEFLHLDERVKVLSGTRTWFESLRLLLHHRGVRLEKLAYTREQFVKLLGDRVALDDLEGVTFAPAGRRTLGLRPREFKVLVLTRPA